MIEGPFAREDLALEQARALYKSGFQFKGNVWLIQKIMELDNHIYNHWFDEEIKKEQ